MPRLCSSLLLSLVIATPASAVTMDWTPIGNAGNACDPQSTGCYGSVGYTYSIGTYEVTNAQYTEFLNAKAQSDPLGLYNTNTALGVSAGYNGITRSGSSGNYTYTAVRPNVPVDFVSFFDALRFANWINNGQGNADTESGAYTLLGDTATPSNGTTVTRNAGATIVLATEDEWYKAAYYDASLGTYFDYPAGFNTQTTCATPPPNQAPNYANCNAAVADLTIKGSYTGSPSPYGTFDQGGNVWEWNETIISDAGLPYRKIRGGSFGDRPFVLAAAWWSDTDPTFEDNTKGFRLALIPEPSTGLLVIAGLLGLSGWRRVSA